MKDSSTNVLWGKSVKINGINIQFEILGEGLCIDYEARFEDKYFLVKVNSYNKWLEVQCYLILIVCELLENYREFLRHLDYL